MKFPLKLDNYLFNQKLTVNEIALYFIISWYLSQHRVTSISLNNICLHLNYSKNKIKELITNLNNKEIIKLKIENNCVTVLDFYRDVDKTRRVSFSKLKILQRDNYTCQQCFSSPVSNKECKLQIHHIIPILKNGTDDDNNLITLCKKCHLKTHKIMRGQL